MEKRFTVHDFDVETNFRYGHLPNHLQKISKPFHEMAVSMVEEFGDTYQTLTGLQKLLEAKDCFVRAAVGKAMVEESGVPSKVTKVTKTNKTNKTGAMNRGTLCNVRDCGGGQCTHEWTGIACECGFEMIRNNNTQAVFCSDPRCD